MANAYRQPNYQSNSTISILFELKLAYSLFNNSVKMLWSPPYARARARPLEHKSRTLPNLPFFLTLERSAILVTNVSIICRNSIGKLSISGFQIFHIEKYKFLARLYLCIDHIQQWIRVYAASRKMQEIWNPFPRQKFLISKGFSNFQRTNSKKCSFFKCSSVLHTKI